MTVSHAPSPGPVVYDFRRPMTLARDHARILEVALGTFSRQWSNQLLARLGVPAQVSLERIGLGTYDDYISTLPPRTTLVTFSVGANRRAAIVQLPLESSLSWVDYMLGGRGTPGAVAERELTEIEQSLVSDLMSRVVADLDYAFAGVFTVNAELRGIQHSPQLLQVLAATTAVVTATFSITVADHRVDATLMVPAERLLATMRGNQTVEHRSAKDIAAEAAQREKLDLAVQQAPVEVAVRLAPVPVHPREVVELAVGDVLPLRHPRTQPMDVVVGDRILAQAVAGTSGSRLAGLVVNVKENS